MAMRDMLNRRRFRKINRSKGPEEMVVGVMVEGEPEYFLMSREATDQDVWMTVFEKVHGRSVSKLEIQLWQYAQMRNDAAQH